jgi:Superfamily II DNA/RNA helicases, SNF2 family
MINTSPIKAISNKGEDTIAHELELILDRNSSLSVISAYFTIYAFSNLKRKLEHINQMRLIFTRPTFVKKDNDIKRQYYIEPNHEKEINGNEFEIKMRNQLTGPHLAKECADWISNKVQFKSNKDENQAVSKLFLVENQAEDKNVSFTGEPDFSADGLGLTSSNRIGTYLAIYGKSLVEQQRKTFDTLWNDPEKVEDVTPQVLKQMQTFYKENSPEWIYFVTLYHIFHDRLGELSEDNIIKTRTGFKSSVIWNKLYKFQKDGVLGIIDKMEHFNGCILADSVGLGKTFTALAVIKYYELRNDRVLVLCPKKLRENWTIYIRNDKRNILVDDRFNYDVLHHTDLSRYKGISGDINLKTINWGNYDLVVIDESHNFRNNNLSVQSGKITRYQRLMQDIIKNGVKTKVLMLSATPVNNRMNDIKNQIAFITEGDSAALSDDGIPNYETTLRQAQMIFNEWSRLPAEERTTDRFVRDVNPDYYKLLDLLTIARSRKHIEKYYDLKDIGRFPKRRKPISIKPNITDDPEFPSMKDLNQIITELNMSVYTPLDYLLANKREKYRLLYDKNNFSQADRERALGGLMRVNLLKRLESSIYSFTKTVTKILDRVGGFIEKIDNKKWRPKDLEIIEEMDFDDPQLDDLKVGNKNINVLLSDIDRLKWRDDLVDDQQKLKQMQQFGQSVAPTHDLKMNKLVELIHNKIRFPINPGNHKVIVFTAFADTANYLYDHLAEKLLKKDGLYAAMVSGGDKKNRCNLKNVRVTDLNDILINFSPVSKERDKITSNISGNIDLLIATDCISEGQNLQDCDYLVNYDIHWNPVRVIQRFGRIDRIGSRNKEIQLVNFWPNMDLDEYINLEQRVRSRMVLLDTSATGEENPFEANQDEMHDLEYRKKQLNALQNEVLDLEDVNGAISITDLTFNDFKMDLMHELATKRRELDLAPTGMYAITSHRELDEAVNGVLFVLRQKETVLEDKENPIKPYFIVYLTDSGKVMYHYTQAKKCLDIMKKLCLGKTVIYQDLVHEFNDETNDGSDMSAYATLLDQAIDHIEGKKEEVGIDSLFSSGGTQMQMDSISRSQNYELVSFLVIK